jgi:hypothetical protein
MAYMDKFGDERLSEVIWVTGVTVLLGWARTVYRIYIPYDYVWRYSCSKYRERCTPPGQPQQNCQPTFIMHVSSDENFWPPCTDPEARVVL